MHWQHCTSRADLPARAVPSFRRQIHLHTTTTGIRAAAPSARHPLPPPPSARHPRPPVPSVCHTHTVHVATAIHTPSALSACRRALCASPATPARRLRPIHATPAVCTPPCTLPPLYRFPHAPLSVRGPVLMPRSAAALHRPAHALGSFLMLRAAAAPRHPAHAPMSVRGLALDALRRRRPAPPRARSRERARARSRRPTPPLHSTAQCTLCAAAALHHPPRARSRERARPPSQRPAPRPRRAFHAPASAPRIGAHVGPLSMPRAHSWEPFHTLHRRRPAPPRPLFDAPRCRRTFYPPEQRRASRVTPLSMRGAPLDAPRRRRAFHHPAHAPASVRGLALGASHRQRPAPPRPLFDAPRRRRAFHCHRPALALDAPCCTALRTLRGACAGPLSMPRAAAEPSTTPRTLLRACAGSLSALRTAAALLSMPAPSVRRPPLSRFPHAPLHGLGFDAPLLLPCTILCTYSFVT
ncbi:hypothetical protein GGX14DRAFT_673815 [Mycena pura]|uniref:Uncharacterized protein n=1 Tax=Mycena pura TaxID=153505 RepID=A0AAD6UVM9_9AGAR|nr:hypothetical protein GGX14DRAFT_673815 [Mycena pura]